MKKKKGVLETAGDGLGVVGKGFNSLFAMAKGDWDKAYELTHGKKTVKTHDKKTVKTHDKKTVKTHDKPIVREGGCKETVLRCPNCKRRINPMVKKCVCGVEFK